MATVESGASSNPVACSQKVHNEWPKTKNSIQLSSLTFCLGNRIFRLGDTVLLFLSPTRNPTLSKNASLRPRSQLLRGRWITLQSRDGRQSSKRCKMKSSSWKPRTKFLRKWISNSRNPSPPQTFNQCHHFSVAIHVISEENPFTVPTKTFAAIAPKIKSKLGPHQRMNITENHQLTRRNRLIRGGWEGPLF